MKKLIATFAIMVVMLAGKAIAQDKEEPLTIEDCMLCHEEFDPEDSATNEDLTFDLDSYTSSVHGQAGVTCVDCHTDITDLLHPASLESRQKVADTCGQCHDDVMELYYQSAHGRLAKEGNRDVATCTDCHGEHMILSPDDQRSTVSHLKMAETCAKCHENPLIISKYNIPVSTPGSQYYESVHGKALLIELREDAATCHDCHGFHAILGGGNPASKVHRSNIAQTCSACHQQITQDYQNSVHGQAFARGENESPTCTDCHGEHSIFSSDDPQSPVNALHLAKEVCGRCHDSLVLNRKYDLPSGRVSSYSQSYHGLASSLGDPTVANCASCHGVHNILAKTDPESMIHPSNLTQTCGACHRGASAEFVDGLVHISRNEREHLVVFWIRRLYIALIVLVIGGMLLHNAIIILRKIYEKFRHQQSQECVTRFGLAWRVQHILLMTSFSLLAITGFSHSFPDFWLNHFFQDYFGWGEQLRSAIHRIAAVVMTLALIWIGLRQCLTKAGRNDLRALLFRFRDLKDVFHNIGFHLGLSKTRPSFDRYDYSEKSEYWALMWGGLIMLATGALMWFPVQLTTWLGLSKAWLDAASVIHYYEAWLATLAIVVWHFFFVIFNPEEYPMSLTWITGKIPVKDMQDRHPEELARMKDSTDL